MRWSIWVVVLVTVGAVIACLFLVLFQCGAITSQKEGDAPRMAHNTILEGVTEGARSPEQAASSGLVSGQGSTLLRLGPSARVSSVDASVRDGVGDLVERYVQARKLLQANWSEYQRSPSLGDDRLKTFDEAQIAQDELLRKVLEVAFLESADFDTVRTVLRDVVEFRSIPKDYATSEQARLAMRTVQPETEDESGPAEAPVVVYFQHLESARGEQFYLLQSTQQRRRSLGIMSLSLARTAGGEADYVRLPYPDWSEAAVSAMYTTPLYAEGMFLTADSVPDIIVVDGPVGSDAFCFLRGMFYDDVRQAWILTGEYQFNSSNWGIDETSQLLGYVEWPKPTSALGPPSEPSERTPNVKEWMRAAPFSGGLSRNVVSARGESGRENPGRSAGTSRQSVRSESLVRRRNSQGKRF